MSIIRRLKKQQDTISARSVADMKFLIIEKIYKKNRVYLLKKEKHYIRKFNSKYKGMNKNC